MSKEILQIPKEKLVTAYRNADNTGRTFLIQLYGREPFGFVDYTDLNGLTNALAYLGRTYEQAFPDKWVTYATNDEIGYRRLKIMIEANNKIMNWAPDWGNENQTKWYPFFNVKSGYKTMSGFALSLVDVHFTNTCMIVGSRLVVGSEAEARHIEKIAHTDYGNFFINF